MWVFAFAPMAVSDTRTVPSLVRWDRPLAKLVFVPSKFTRATRRCRAALSSSSALDVLFGAVPSEEVWDAEHRPLAAGASYRGRVAI